MASAERHQTLADIRAQTPAKFTHIADRWPRRCAQGRRGGAASNGGRRHEARNEFAAGEGRRIPVDFRGDSALNRRPSYEGIEVKLRFPVSGELRFWRQGTPLPTSYPVGFAIHSGEGVPSGGANLINGALAGPGPATATAGLEPGMER
jgi:hypothetical protein